MPIEEIIQKISEFEKIIKRELGKVELKKIRDYAFEHACVEAELINLEKKGMEFCRLCLIRREAVIREVYGNIKSGKQNPAEDRTFDIRYQDKEELRKKVSDLYSGKKIS